MHAKAAQTYKCNGVDNSVKASLGISGGYTCCLSLLSEEVVGEPGIQGGFNGLIACPAAIVGWVKGLVAFSKPHEITVEFLVVHVGISF